MPKGVNQPPTAKQDVVLGRVLFQIASARFDEPSMTEAVQILATATEQRLTELDPHGPDALMLVAQLASARLVWAKATGDRQRMEDFADVLAVAAVRLSATVGTHDLRSKSAVVAMVIAQFELARDGGLPEHVEHAAGRLRSLLREAERALSHRTPQYVTLRLATALADLEAARVAKSPTRMTDAVAGLRDAAEFMERIHGPQSVQTLEAFANLELAELDLARAKRNRAMVERATVGLDEARRRLAAGLGTSHPLTVVVEASLRLGNDLLAEDNAAMEPYESAGRIAVTDTALMVRTASASWGMDREYVSLGRAVALLEETHRQQLAADPPLEIPFAGIELIPPQPIENLLGKTGGHGATQTDSSAVTQSGDLGITADELEEILSERSIVTGTIFEVTEAGLWVNIGMSAYLPAALLDVDGPIQPSAYTGRRIAAMVIDIDGALQGLPVTLSRSSWLKPTPNSALWLGSLEPQQMISGVVSEIDDFGVIVDLGAGHGLCYHPLITVTVGDLVTAAILDVDPTRQLVTLALRDRNAPLSFK